MITTLITLAFIGATQQQAPDLTEDLKKVTVESLAEKMAASIRMSTLSIGGSVAARCNAGRREWTTLKPHRRVV